MVQLSFDATRSAGDEFSFEKTPGLCYVGLLENQPNWYFPSHKHNDLSEVIYIAGGEGIFKINNQTYKGGKGDILIYNKGVIHEEFSKPDAPVKLYFLGIGNVAISGLAEGDIIPATVEPVLKRNECSPYIEACMKKIFQENQDKQPGFAAVCQQLTLIILTIIQRITAVQKEPVHTGRAPSLSLRMKTYIEENYMENITLQQIADHFFISPSYVCHIFKKDIGYSPMHYLLRCRIGEAKRLLLTTDLRIYEIARLVGYDNPNYFTMMFKEMTRETPTQFRRNNTTIKGLAAEG
ncbi:AraC family transcriptional regulator [Halalkalibacter oceani]|uniref:AraC family transcriptional regulator n=1 Tax=Halalkalibacter oceani TaxID=1653776 RepID=UPI003392AF25